MASKLNLEKQRKEKEYSAFAITDPLECLALTHNFSIVSLWLLILLLSILNLLNSLPMLSEVNDCVFRFFFEGIFTESANNFLFFYFNFLFLFSIWYE